LGVKVKKRKAVTGILFVRVFLLDVKYSENTSRGFPGNSLTVAVILERGNTDGEVNISHEITTMVVWIDDGVY